MEPWKNSIVKYLGRKVVRHAETLMKDLVAVDLGIKPAYLYDVGQPIGKHLEDFLRDIKQKKLIRNNLSVIEIEMDCLIVNVEELKHNASQMDFDKRLIDVSKYLNKPEMCSVGDASASIKESLENLVQELDCGKVQFLSHCCLTCNITSLFGVLLNYPVIYWYDNQDGKGDNCLSMERLTNVKVEINYIQKNGPMLRAVSKNSHCLYSFSYPSCLGITCRPIVDQWFDRIKDKVKGQDVFSDVKVRFEEVILEAVCL